MKYQNVIDLVKSTKEIVFSEEKLNEIIAKGYADFVTGVDLAVQTYLESELSKLYPDVQFMGEEGEKSKLDFTKKIWVLDPIDGTSNLIHHLNLSAVSLALVDNNIPVFGVVHQVNGHTADELRDPEACGLDLRDITQPCVSGSTQIVVIQHKSQGAAAPFLGRTTDGGPQKIHNIHVLSPFPNQP